MESRAYEFYAKKHHSLEANTTSPGEAMTCNCSNLCFASEVDLAALQDKRHHSACTLHRTEKYPRLFYYEEAENCWTPVPERIENIIDVQNFMGDNEIIEIQFRRSDMTDAEFYNLEEV
jgi:hypothetical protein